MSATASPPALPALLDDWRRALVGEHGSLAEAKAQAESARERVERLKDPFTPLALGDKEARAKERVLWEDARVMVVVDIFAGSPKALVVPKTPMYFPTDADDDTLAHLAHVAAATGRAFTQASGENKEPRSWINPPSALMVKQLHVHVQPGLSWARLPESQDIFYAQVSAHLEALLKA